MKKRLEADLISIAHRILQIKDKSDVNQLYLETQKLYEKLSVLKFVEENYSDVKPTIGNYSEIEKEIENFYDKEALLPVETEIEMNESNMFQDTKSVEPIAENKEEETEIEAIVEAETIIDEGTTDEEIVTDENDEELVSIEETETEDNTIEFHESEPEIEEEDETEEDVENVAEEIPEFKASFELTDEVEAEELQVEEVKKPETVQISFEDLLGLSYNEPEFVKVDDIPAPNKEVVFEPIETPVEKAIETTEKTTSKTVSLNDKLAKKGIEIDLNDRIAFVKHLFGNSNEDYNRVMNQLITYDNFFETKSFIDEMVKPDYNNWKGKEEYEERFMEIIEKKFL
ncbi:hypothetical protein AAGV28_04180 [Flavobacterium sp. FZUC8N2.13]|uniref:DUF4476 domain-containing protein n=1 Tax=Flavobacterium zubiriense TaxID=3138075 RepID=A0ABV4T970_9FLAO